MKRKKSSPYSLFRTPAEFLCPGIHLFEPAKGLSHAGNENPPHVGLASRPHPLRPKTVRGIRSLSGVAGPGDPGQRDRRPGGGGDVFDTTAAGNRAQELYYRFLRRAGSLGCRHVVVVSGNHDSPSFLDAPKELLKALEVHVTGSPSGNPEDEVLVLRDGQGVPELIVCAVPHLRDRDIRTAEAGESIEDKERKLLDGIREHYAAVAACAEEKRRELGGAIPILATGHLFAAGGRTVEGDGVRELYVGSLAHVDAGIFPPCFEYVALGHLHVPQKVNGSETVRYSGSPLPMGFGEAKQQKSVCVAEFGGRDASVRLLTVPVFQQLEQIRGDWDLISGRIFELASQGSRAWLEVVYDGDEILGDLRERLEEAVGNTSMEVLRVRNTRAVERALGADHGRRDPGRPGRGRRLPPVSRGEPGPRRPACGAVRGLPGSGPLPLGARGSAGTGGPP